MLYPFIVILDAELAALHGVSTKRLNEQIKRNAERFPEDFLFRLTRADTEALNRSQIVSGSQKHRDPRFAPFAFNEHRAIVAATILSSPRAVERSVFVVRAIAAVRSAIRELMSPPAPARRGIGFTADLDK